MKRRCVVKETLYLIISGCCLFSCAVSVCLWGGVSEQKADLPGARGPQVCGSVATWPTDECLLNTEK